jgi:osmoprotectant transport system ATP-binding protein
VMNNGRLIQTGAPAAILLAPADEFVRGFLGGDDLQLRLLDLVPVRTLMKRGKSGASATIAAGASLKTALNLMLARRCSSLCVEDESGARLGEIHLNDIIARRDAI